MELPQELSAACTRPERGSVEARATPSALAQQSARESMMDGLDEWLERLHGARIDFHEAKR